MLPGKAQAELARGNINHREKRQHERVRARWRRIHGAGRYRRAITFSVTIPRASRDSAAARNLRPGSRIRQYERLLRRQEVSARTRIFPDEPQDQ